MKHYEINVWAIALKMMLMFRRVFLLKRKTSTQAVQFKVFLDLYLALTVVFSW